MRHENHPVIIKRLKRASGHLQTITGMIEQGRPRSQIAQQLRSGDVLRELSNRQRQFARRHRLGASHGARRMGKCIRHARDQR